MIGFKSLIEEMEMLFRLVLSTIYHIHLKSHARASEFALNEYTYIMSEDYIVVSKMYLIKIDKSMKIIYVNNIIFKLRFGSRSD